MNTFHAGCQTAPMLGTFEYERVLSNAHPNSALAQFLSNVSLFYYLIFKYLKVSAILISTHFPRDYFSSFIIFSCDRFFRALIILYFSLRSGSLVAEPDTEILLQGFTEGSIHRVHLQGLEAGWGKDRAEQGWTL